jgi:membrane protease subunit (stomatin/prohibitin family)
VLEINAYISEISDSLKESISPAFTEFGIDLVNFHVNDISVPEDDTAVIKLKDALAKKAEMDIIGYSYTQERSFDTLEGAATNPNGGQAGLMGTGIGLGMGFGIGGVMGSQAGGIAQSINVKDMKKCPNCNAAMEASARFCPSCGHDTQKPIQGKSKENDITVCNKCGAAYPKKSKFCPECGDVYTPCSFCGADMKAGAAVCPVCGKAIPKSCPKCGSLIEHEKAKFCPECGESFVKKCGNCGAMVEGNPKFCPECGKKVDGDNNE